MSPWESGLGRRSDTGDAARYPGVVGTARVPSPIGRAETMIVIATAIATYSQALAATHHADNTKQAHLELPVEELLRRARPLPPHDEMVIEDIDEQEGAGFLAAVDS
jgi:hypothetical protein